MTFVITARRPNCKPSVLNMPDLAEAEARNMCRNLAANGMEKVTLHSLSDSGLIEAVAAWSAGGKRARKIAPTNGAPKVQTVTATPEQIEDAVTEGLEAQESEDPADAIEITEDVADEDQGQVYGAYCMKCKTAREFHVHEVVELKNGTLMAKGKCPVCGGGVNRILPKGERPEPEWTDEDAKETEKDEAPAALPAPEPEAAPSVEFSESQEPAAKRGAAKAVTAAAKAEKPARKRTTKKVAAAEDGVPAEVKEMQQVATCPQCGRKQPVMDRAGLTIFMQHSAPGLDRCPGSSTVVN